jgi:hypothetical protein
VISPGLITAAIGPSLSRMSTARFIGCMRSPTLTSTSCGNGSVSSVAMTSPMFHGSAICRTTTDRVAELSASTLGPSPTKMSSGPMNAEATSVICCPTTSAA